MEKEKNNNENESNLPKNFIKEIIDEHNKTGRFNNKVHTRFPPEPNGYLHIGHAKSICLNFGIAKEYGGKCNLRFDDTNPVKEDIEYVNSIQEDIKWLGFDWEDRLYYASDYFQKLYEYAVVLIKKGRAYVDSLTADEIRAYRGMPTVPGKESPYRNRSIDENLELFDKMKNGEFADGTHILRAKIDMSSPNMNMRDPAIYRIRKTSHHRTGDTWCIYPMYDFAHGFSDSIEGITHSICTLEFENHRPLYDWFLDEVEAAHHPQQIEFARLNLSYTVMSKRKLLQLVEEKIVDDWDDPRMPTISALRRRGFTARAIRNFAEEVGVARRDGVIDVARLEFAVREDLNKTAARVMAVINPVKLVITNYPEDKSENLDAVNNPEDASAGSRTIPFSRELFIEREDFMENPPRKFFRLSPGNEVRLRYAYIIKCEDVLKDADGNITEIHCTYDPETKSGMANSNKKVKGTIHWVSAKHAFDAEVRLYDRLFSVEDPSGDKETDFKEFLNPESLEIRKNCKLEPGLMNALAGDRFQFERLGYFCVDSKYSEQGTPVFNRTVTLRDTWARMNK